VRFGAWSNRHPEVVTQAREVATGAQEVLLSEKNRGTQGNGT